MPAAATMPAQASSSLCTFPRPADGMGPTQPVAPAPELLLGRAERRPRRMAQLAFLFRVDSERKGFTITAAPNVTAT